jgi:hypothetical protein
MPAFVALALAMLLPAYAQATTVTMGDPDVPLETRDTFECKPCMPGLTLAQGFTPDGEVNSAPASGLITSWRVLGGGAVRLSVLESAEDGGWVLVGTSAAATNTDGQPNATSLPIGFGDIIGVELVTGGNRSAVENDPIESGEVIEWLFPLTSGEAAREPEFTERGARLELNAEVAFTPVISSLSPSSGSTTGGNAVKISGKYLDGATSVTFGSTPASSFSVDSSNQITAIAPPTVASTVDVRVTGPGGSSEAVSADKYTFTAPAATSPAPVTKTLIQSGAALGPANPAVTGFSESAARWRRGRSLPRISSTGGAPVGTTFSFSLNEPATVTFAFTRSVAGRRARGRCVASHANAHKARCRRTVSVGSFSVAGKAGLDKVRFQGRLSSAKTLKPGTYSVSINARNANGLKGVSRSVSFTIVS